MFGQNRKPVFSMALALTILAAAVAITVRPQRRKEHRCVQQQARAWRTIARQFVSFAGASRRF
jgi:hypothetical protein